MNPRLIFTCALAAMSIVPAGAFAQRYPITVVPPGKETRAFPPGYQTPWDKIEMMVTEKLSPNLYCLHGSAGLDPAHPDAAGGRVAVLFGSDGVLMVDTEDPQLAPKTLQTIRTFTERADQSRGQFAYSPRPHRRRCLLCKARRGDLRAGESAR